MDEEEVWGGWIEGGHVALEDLVCCPDDAAFGGLAEDPGEAHDRQDAAVDEVCQNAAWADGGELIDIAYQHQ